MSAPYQLPLQSYAALKDYMNYISGLLGTDFSGAPHGAFWNTCTYEQFTTGDVPHVSPSVPILVIGNGAGSNIVQALQGVGQFGPTGNFNQMPADGSGPWTEEQIKPLIAWIDAKCPNMGA